MSSLSVPKNLQALTLSVLFSAAAAQAAEPPVPIAGNFFIGTSAQENFSAQGSKNGVDFSNSTATMTISLKDGVGTNTGAGGFSTGDTVDSSIKNLIGSNSASNAGYNILIGNADNNTLYGTGSSKNILDGGAGADTLVGSPDGWNWARYTSSPVGVTVDLGAGKGFNGDAQGDTLYNIDAVDGSKFGDTLTGSARSETLRAGAGLNFLNPKEGNDTSIGGIDTDMYIYTAGNDSIQEATAGSAGQMDTVIFASKYSPTQAVISGNMLSFDSSQNSITFNDINLIERFSFSGYPSMTLGQLKTASTITPDPFYENAQSATSSADNFAGVNGDTVNYSFSPTPVTISLENGATGSGGDAQNDTYGNDILNIVGADTPANAGYNKLIGDENNNRLYGLGSSKNILDGRGGADTLVGSPDGWNWVEYTSSPSAVTINLASNANTGGHAQGDLLYKIDAVKGSAFDDNFTGNADSNTFDGMGGSDSVTFNGNFSDHTITNSAGKLTVKDNRIPSLNGTDTIINAEKLVFTDGTYEKTAGSNTNTSADWTFNSLQPEGTISTKFTMQAENMAGYSNESKVFDDYKKVNAGTREIHVEFNAPDHLMDGSCVATLPVTDYHVNVMAYDENNALYNRTTYSFDLAEPTLNCFDDVDKYVEECGVFTQKCDAKVTIDIPEPGQ